MEARCATVGIIAAAVFSLGAGYRTANFVVQAQTPQIAEEVGEAAEKLRRELAIEWLGRAMPNWTHPCPIEVTVGPNLGAGGATTFMFDHGEAFGWQMNIQGTLQRVLDSVLPHEVTHTVFASHFRQPLPRWADEGASSTVEHDIERRKQQRALVEYLKTRRGIPFSQMFAMKEYPRDILPLYAQGHSLATFLIAQGGKQKYLKFVGAGLRGEAWGRATREFYGFENLGALQKSWLDWVRHGSRLPLASSTLTDDAREALTRVGPADAEPADARPAPAELAQVDPAQVELARADPARRPVPEDVEREGMSSQGAGEFAPVRRAAAVKSKAPGPAARAAEQVSIYEGRGRRDTLRR